MEDYAFRTCDLGTFFSLATKANVMDSDEDKLSSLSDYAVKTISVYGVPENFMSVIDNKYYIEEDVQDVGDSLGRLGDG